MDKDSSKKTKKTVTINGKTYPSGKNIKVDSSGVWIDGTLVDNLGEVRSKKIEIKVYGDLESVVTTSGNIEVKGNVGSATTASGDIAVNGNIGGNVSTASGDIKAKSIGGECKTVSGDIIGAGNSGERRKHGLLSQIFEEIDEVLG